MAVAQRANARVFSLPREHFGYGRALNLGARLCRGDIVVMLSAHSVPTSAGWLATLIAPIRTGVAAASFCRQVPSAHATRLERRRFRYFPATDRLTTRSDFVARCAAGADPYECAAFSNSACAIRRDVAVAHPFRDLPYAEDRAFAVDCLMAGVDVAYVSGCSVSYERPADWRATYRIAARAQVSKRLIRELAATYTGRRYDSRRDTASRLARAALVGPGLVVLLLLCAREPRDRQRRAVGCALRSTGGTLGLAKGCLLWRRHTGLLSFDESGFQLALAHCTVPGYKEALASPEV